MGQQSDYKTQLVLEVCSISTRSVVCVHTLLSNPAKPPFIDWYCILGVSISSFFFYENANFVPPLFCVLLYDDASLLLGCHRWKKMQGCSPSARNTINLVGRLNSVFMVLCNVCCLFLPHNRDCCF